MRGFRAGTFEREHMPRALRRFSPASSLERVEDVDLVALKAQGKRLVLLDVDNTLLPWRHHEFEKPVQDWIEAGKSMGFSFCILSNTRHPARLTKLSEILDVPFIRARFKPSSQMYTLALQKFGVKAEEAVMIGDQLLTDILGANRTGIDAIWIRPLAAREFIGTRLVSRNIERVIGRVLFDYVERPAGVAPGFFRSDLLKQIIKFCIVGGSSFVIDYCVKMTLMLAVPYGDGRLSVKLGEWILRNYPGIGPLVKNSAENAALWPISVVAASIAILNSFFWNRRWTFRAMDREERSRQFGRFLVISLIGLALNATFTTVFKVVLPGDPTWSLRFAIILAAAITAIWNFTGQRLYAFKKRS